MLEITSIADNVRKYIEGQICTGELPPGRQLKEQEIATTLGVSRPPIREAFKLLEADGLISRKPNRGVFVARITAKDAWEIYTLKAGLYELATQLAFERISTRDIRVWQRILEEMNACVTADPPDVDQYQELNQEFHNRMILISGHERLGRMVAVLHNQVKRFSYRSLQRPAHLRESLSYHRDILAAVEDGNYRRCSDLTREHIFKALEMVQVLISEESGPGFPEDHSDEPGRQAVA